VRLILGIGNPGERYRKNRHNVGFMFIDYLAMKYSLSFIPSQKDYYFAEHSRGENHFSLIKPTGYVNNSGFSVVQALAYYSASINDLLVIYDDIYLQPGVYRVKLSGGDGGHKGIRSIIFHVASADLPRLRIGVGGTEYPTENISEYVLSDFSMDEERIINNTFVNCAHLTESFINGGTKQLLDTNSQLIKSIKNLEIN
jgi:PTH1 family peptidyl-tRNA hydrolase